MLKTLKFIAAALDKGGHLPGSDFFRIAGGMIQANSGKIAIQAPLEISLECAPHGEQFMRAVAACDDVISLHVESGKLVVKSGKFKTHVNLIGIEKARHFAPAGPMHAAGEALTPILSRMLPFVSDDASRWGNAVKFAGHSIIATNSIVLVETWLPVPFPVPAILARESVAQIAALKSEPVAVQDDERALAFHLPGGAWIACPKLVTPWPDTSPVFASAAKYSGPYLAGEALAEVFASVAKIAPFCGPSRAVYFHKGRVSTCPAGDPGTDVDCDASPGKGIFHCDQLAGLRDTCDRIGFGAYPGPVPFFHGERTRGIIVGFQN